MDLEDIFGDIDYGILGVALVLWVIACLSFWVFPSLLGVPEYPLWMRITATIALLPLSYIVVQMISNR